MYALRVVYPQYAGVLDYVLLPVGALERETLRGGMEALCSCPRIIACLGRFLLRERAFVVFVDVCGRTLAAIILRRSRKGVRRDCSQMIMAIAM